MHVPIPPPQMDGVPQTMQKVMTVQLRQTNWQNNEPEAPSGGFAIY